MVTLKLGLVQVRPTQDLRLDLMKLQVSYFVLLFEIWIIVVGLKVSKRLEVDERLIRQLIRVILVLEPVCAVVVI